jgi:hypothetical protein
MARKKFIREKDTLPGPDASDREVAEFWETHSAADYWDELEPVDLGAKPPPRRVVTLRLDPKAVDALRVIARRRGMDYSTLVRSWIVERLRDELRASAAGHGRK